MGKFATAPAQMLAQGGEALAHAQINSRSLKQLPCWLLEPSGHPDAPTFLRPDSSRFHMRLKSAAKPSRFSGPFASLSLRDASARRTFNAIDADSKGFLTVEDFRNYALDNGLPMSYVDPFMSAVLGPPAENKRRVPEGTDRNVYFSAFRCFTGSREEALKKAFNLFDKDGDGKISVEDLNLSLTHVIIQCPATRCVYKSSNCKIPACTISAQNLLSTARSPSPNLLSNPVTLASANKATSKAVKSMKQTKRSKQSKQNLDINFIQFRDFFLLLPQTDMIVEYWLKAGRCPDVDARVQLRDSLDRTGASPWGHLLSGAVAGAASRTATAPLETLRLGVMSGSLEAGTLMQQANTIIERGGSWKALYRGNSVNVMRSAPQKALDFLLFDIIKQKMKDDSTLKTFAAAGIAGATSWSILYPLEVVRSRVTSGLVTSSNIPRVLSSIARTEGISTLYKGLGWSVAGIIPEAAITYGLHDVLKRSYKKLRGQESPVPVSLAFGIASAFAGQTVSFPLETISRRMQVGQSIPTILKEVSNHGGIKYLYRGIGAATLRLIPMAMVSFGVYEFMRAQLLQFEELREKQRADEDYSKLHDCYVALEA